MKPKRKRQIIIKSRKERKNLSSLFKDIQENNLSLNEEANIRSYSPQAIGRKRNTFLHTLALDNDAFVAWVRDRLYRIAYDNQNSISDYTPKDIEMGLSRWEDALRQGDNQFGKYTEQFREYTKRFLEAAKILLAQGEASLGVKPSKAPSPTIEGSPTSPKLLKYKTGNVPKILDQIAQQRMSMGGAAVPGGPAPTGAEGQQVSPEQMGQMDPAAMQQPIGPDGMPIPLVSPEEEMFLSYIQNMEDALKLKDDEFMLHVEDALLNAETDPFIISQDEIESILNYDFDKLISSIPKESSLAVETESFEKLFDKYKKKFLKFAEKTLQQSKTEQILGYSPKEEEPVVRYDPTDFESSVVYAFTQTGNTTQPFEFTRLKLSQVNKIKSNPGLEASGKNFVRSLMEKYPLLSRAFIYSVSGKADESQLQADYDVRNVKSGTNIVFLFEKEKVNLVRGKLKRCSDETLVRECTSKIKCILMLDDYYFPLSTTNPKEIECQLDYAIRDLEHHDYMFMNAKDLERRLSQDGIQPEFVSNTASNIFSHKEAILDSLQNFFVNASADMSSLENVKKTLEYHREQAKKFTELYMNSFKDFIRSFLKENLLGEYKFLDTAEAKPEFLLVGDTFGNNAFLFNLDEIALQKISVNSEIVIETQPDKLQNINYLQKYITKKEKENIESQSENTLFRINKERPYTINNLLNLLDNDMEMLRSLRSVNPNVPISEFLSEETREYVESCIQYAKMSLGKFLKFFDIRFKNIEFKPLNITNTLLS